MTDIRGGEKLTLFYSYNPPKSQRNWVEYTVDSGAYSGYKRGYVYGGYIQISGSDLNKVSVENEDWSHQYKALRNMTVFDRPNTSALVIGAVYKNNLTHLIVQVRWRNI